MEETVMTRMKKHDKFIGDVLAPFEQALGMKFNKFDKPEDPKYIDPKKKGGLKTKLKKAERKQEKLKKLQESDPTKVKEMHWQNAMDKAQGLKVKDDPKLIRKALKRKEAERKKHKKQWAERVAKQKNSKPKKKGKQQKGRKHHGGKK